MRVGLVGNVAASDSRLYRDQKSSCHTFGTEDLESI